MWCSASQGLSYDGLETSLYPAFFNFSFKRRNLFTEYRALKMAKCHTHWHMSHLLWTMEETGVSGGNSKQKSDQPCVCASSCVCARRWSKEKTRRKRDRKTRKRKRFYRRSVRHWEKGAQGVTWCTWTQSSCQMLQGDLTVARSFKFFIWKYYSIIIWITIFLTAKLKHRRTTPLKNTLKHR